MISLVVSHYILDFLMIKKKMDFCSCLWQFWCVDQRCLSQALTWWMLIIYLPFHWVSILPTFIILLSPYIQGHFKIADPVKPLHVFAYHSFPSSLWLVVCPGEIFPYISYISMCHPKGYCSWAGLVWKWGEILTIVVWNRVWFSWEPWERTNAFVFSIPNV